MNVSVDKTRCQGIGQCEAAAPTIFAVNDDGQADVLRQPTVEERSAVEAAVGLCPTAAVITAP